MASELAHLRVSVACDYVTGTGQHMINVHQPSQDCWNGCVIHHPTPHAMRDFPTHWREDRGLMERICPHGVGHPDPDNIQYIRRVRSDRAARVEAVHGCDGCCQAITDEQTAEDAQER